MVKELYKKNYIYFFCLKNLHIQKVLTFLHVATSHNFIINAFISYQFYNSILIFSETDEKCS